MNRTFNLLAFALGLAVVLWIGERYLSSANPLALLMTALIGATYLAGASELLRFNRGNASLGHALTRLTSEPEGQVGLSGQGISGAADRLEGVPAAWRAVLGQRLAGEAVALPQPVLAPYLVGMLVLLGMLGTFLGLVMTLDGAVQALQMSTDLQAMRGALAAPVKGLGVAFGTSVAGVAASAMLGLLLALFRRQRLQLAQRLERCLQTSLREHSLDWQREQDRLQAYAALKAQAEQLPRLVSGIEQLTDSLLAQQQQAEATRRQAEQTFQEELRAANRAELSQLAQTLEASLDSRFATSSSAAVAALNTLTTEHLGLAQTQASAFQQQLGEHFQQQLAALCTQQQSATSAWLEALQGQLATHNAQQQQTLKAQLAAEERMASQFAGQLQQAQEQFGSSIAAIEHSLLNNAEAAYSQQQQGLATFRTETSSQAQQLLEGLQQLQAVTLEQLEERIHGLLRAQGEHAQTQRGELEALLERAASAPNAVLGLLTELEQQLRVRLASDAERSEAQKHSFEQFASLLTELDGRSREQATAQLELLGESVRSLQDVSREFARQSSTQHEVLQGSSAEINVSALEMSALSEAFSLAVAEFAASNAQLGAQLDSIERRLEQSLQRSDEQLAYYVAQARELIDLSLLSQQRILAALTPASESQS